uniref:Uncharacterized protein n=1 Tax=Rhizophora mucronata TaxID=61149 RepID=A0A2P2P593_RHIMU
MIYSSVDSPFPYPSKQYKRCNNSSSS